MERPYPGRRPTILQSKAPTRIAFCATALAACGVAALGWPLEAGAQPASPNELAVLKSIRPHLLELWASGVSPTAEGATDANRQGFIQVGFQYHTFNLLPAALVNNDTHLVDEALRMAEYAFRHQHPDGSFDYGESNGTTVTGTPPNPEAAASTVTIFFTDFGHSMLFLKQSDWFQHSPDCAPFRARLDALRAPARTSLAWLLGQRSILATDRAAANRTFQHALAFYFVGKALGDSRAMDAGKAIFSQQLDAAFVDGTFPEAGGFDSSYQGFNLLECEWMLLHLDQSDPLYARTFAAIKKGYAREIPSIAASGDVSTVGNTRVRSEGGESYLGHRKSINAKQLFLALAYYGAMFGDDNASRLATNVQRFYYPEKTS